MPNQSRLFQYLKTAEGRFSLLLVVLCGLALAFFTTITFFDPPEHLYRLDFGRAQWIQSTTPSQTNYFRKTLYISGPIDRAWIQVAATDNFALYVNNAPVGNRIFNSTCVAGIFDLKSLLKPGKNVIAIHVIRYSFPGSAQLLVRGFYGIVGSPVQEFWSDLRDQSWRASKTPDGILGGYTWENPLLDDSFWPLPQAGAASERFPIIEQVPVDPRLLASRPVAKWITPAEGSPRQASFQYHLMLPKDRRETWLQIAAPGNYDLVINGRLITTEIGLPPAPITKVVQESLPLSPPLLAYDITRWLHTGDNTLLVRVSSQTMQPAVMLAEGYTALPDHSVRTFYTDGNWQTLSYSSEERPALVLANYGNQPWGILPQRLALPVVTPLYDVQRAITWVEVFSIVLGGVLVSWLLIPRLVSFVTRHPVERLWTDDALFLLCVLAVMLLGWLLCFDVRFPSSWCFKPQVVYNLVIVIFAGRLLLFLPRKKLPPSEATPAEPPPAHWLSRYWKVVALICIVILGFFLRANNLTAMSLDVDEYGVTQFSHGVQAKGYPFIQLGSFEKEVTTYELVSYGVALARQLFGESETAYRTPAVILSTLTIALIGVAGWRMMGWRVGLTAALIFATFPSGLFWGRNAFWPSQEQFFSLTTFWCFYEAIRVRGGPIRAGFMSACTIGFVLAYLTWEGSGFILPTLFLCMFALQWGKYDWMKDWHLWRCCVFMSFAVAIQLTHRQVASMPAYMQTGISLSDVTTPVPVWFDVTHYDPQYYFNDFVLAENFFVMSLVTILGIVFCWGDRAIRYLFLSGLVMLMFYVEFLPAYAARYSYDYQSLLILVSVGIVYKLVDRIVAVRGTALRLCAAIALLTIFVLTTNGFVLYTYRLSRTGPAPFYGNRMGIYRTDYRGAALFVASHIQPGDALIVAIPHIFEFYSKLRVDYSINTMLDKKITYSGVGAVPFFLDKFRGYPCIRTLEELQNLRGLYKRIWIVQVPLGPADNQHPDVVAYLQQNSRIAYQSYKAEVDLILGTANVAQRTEK